MPEMRVQWGSGGIRGWDLTAAPPLILESSTGFNPLAEKRRQRDVEFSHVKLLTMLCWMGFGIITSFTFFTKNVHFSDSFGQYWQPA